MSHGGSTCAALLRPTIHTVHHLCKRNDGGVLCGVDKRAVEGLAAALCQQHRGSNRGIDSAAAAGQGTCCTTMIELTLKCTPP